MSILCHFVQLNGPLEKNFSLGMDIIVFLNNFYLKIYFFKKLFLTVI